MATRTSSQSGNWNASATWGGAAPPGIGDTAVLSSGHTITVTADATVGLSTAATNAISGTGSLTIATGVTLTVRGNYAIGSLATFTLQGTGAIEFDSSATTPTSTKYVMSLTYRSNLAATGSGCSIRSNAGGGNAYITCSQGGVVDIRNCNLTRIGDSANSAVTITSLTTDVAGNRFLFTGNTLTSCGAIATSSGVAASHRLEIQDNRDVTPVGTNGSVFGISADTLSTSGFSYYFASPAATTGTRLFQRVAAKKVIYFATTDTWTIENWVAGNNLITVNNIAPPATIQNGLNIQDQTILGSGRPIVGSLKNIYFVANSTITDNWHSCSVTNTTNTTVDGCIWDAVGVINNSDTGEAYMRGSPSVARTLTFKNCIALPSQANQSGLSSRALTAMLVFSGTTQTNLTSTVEHNTQYLCPGGGTNPALYQTGESAVARTGEAASLQGNLVWGTETNCGYVLRDVANGGVTFTNDIATIAAYNGKYNIAASKSGTASTGYFCNTSATTPGTGDVTGNPNFVDPWRNIATWATSIGLSGANNQALVDAAVDYISADTSLINTRLSALFTYVRNGFRPTNAAFRNASYPSDAATTDANGNAYTGIPDIGAMAWMSGATYMTNGGEGPTFNFLEA